MNAKNIMRVAGVILIVIAVSILWGTEMRDVALSFQTSVIIVATFGLGFFCVIFSEKIDRVEVPGSVLGDWAQKDVSRRLREIQR